MTPWRPSLYTRKVELEHLVATRTQVNLPKGGQSVTQPSIATPIILRVLHRNRSFPNFEQCWQLDLHLPG